MKKKKNISKLVATAAFAVASVVPSFAQQNLGEACGCPPTTARPTASLSAKASGGSFTAANTVLTCDTTWLLDAKLFVDNGKKITINPGTLIKGTPGTGAAASALIVSRGADIYANGTESCPIVFTAQADPMDGTYGIATKGQWGGVIVLGTAYNNLTSANSLYGGATGVGFIEGWTAAEPRILFGAGDAAFPTVDDNDNSGVIKYVSIRHGGAIVGAANEINGLTLGSVGRGTSIHHIEVVSNLDDGIEFFGGTVDLKYGAVLFNDDDGFDWDLGWSGRGQFWTVVKTDQGTATGGDNGFESDGDDGKINAAVLSNPLVYNATYIGSNGINGNGTTKGRGIEGKEQTKGTIRNSIIANYQTGFNLADDATRPGGTDAYDNWLAGTFKVECNTFVANTNLFRVNNINVTSGGADEIKFFADGNLAPASIAGFDVTHAMNTTTNVVTDKNDPIPTANLATTCTAAPVDGFFTAANYRGAFEAGKKSWLSNWSISVIQNAAAGTTLCPTDINGDGSTTNADFLQLLGQFNQSCY